MNLVAWIRENAGMFQVTAAIDPSEYSISYGEGNASVMSDTSWTLTSSISRLKLLVTMNENP